MSTEEELIAELLAEVRSDGDVVAGPTNLDRRAASTISRLSAEVQELRAERDMAERAACMAVIPLEALMMAGQGYLSDAVWDEVRNGVGHVRSMLAARARRRAAHGGETGPAAEGRQSGVDCGENAP